MTGSDKREKGLLSTVSRKVTKASIFSWQTGYYKCQKQLIGSFLEYLV